MRIVPGRDSGRGKVSVSGRDSRCEKVSVPGRDSGRGKVSVPGRDSRCFPGKQGERGKCIESIQPPGDSAPTNA